MATVSRKFIADSLKKAGFGYLLKIGFSCFQELGVCPWGKLRADILAVNLKSEVVICEVKSSVADFTTDDKWREYLQYCNRFFFIFTESVWEKLKPRFRDDFLAAGAGVLVLCPKEGLLRVKLPCKRKPMKGSIKKLVVTRMAWRGGEASKRNARRDRVFLTESDYNDFRQQKEKENSSSTRRKRTRRPSRRTRRRRTS